MRHRAILRKKVHQVNCDTGRLKAVQRPQSMSRPGQRQMYFWTYRMSCCAALCDASTFGKAARSRHAALVHRTAKSLRTHRQCHQVRCACLQRESTDTAQRWQCACLEQISQPLHSLHVRPEPISTAFHPFLDHRWEASTTEHHLSICASCELLQVTFQDTLQIAKMPVQAERGAW